jgi:hypothetical protein
MQGKSDDEQAPLAVDRYRLHFDPGKSGIDDLLNIHVAKNKQHDVTVKFYDIVSDTDDG